MRVPLSIKCIPSIQNSLNPNLVDTSSIVRPVSFSPSLETSAYRCGNSGDQSFGDCQVSFNVTLAVDSGLRSTGIPPNSRQTLFPSYTWQDRYSVRFLLLRFATMKSTSMVLFLTEVLMNTSSIYTSLRASSETSCQMPKRSGEEPTGAITLSLACSMNR